MNMTSVLIIINTVSILKAAATKKKMEYSLLFKQLPVSSPPSPRCYVPKIRFVQLVHRMNDVGRFHFILYLIVQSVSFQNIL